MESTDKTSYLHIYNVLVSTSITIKKMIHIKNNDRACTCVVYKSKCLYNYLLSVWRGESVHGSLGVVKYTRIRKNIRWKTITRYGEEDGVPVLGYKNVNTTDKTPKCDLVHKCRIRPVWLISAGWRWCSLRSSSVHLSFYLFLARDSKF